MNKKLKKLLENTTSWEVFEKELSKDFTDEQNRMVEEGIREYDMLLKLRKTRKKAGLTQAQLAAKANLPRTTITKIESGTYNPTVSTLAAMASAMNKKLEINFS